MFTDELKPLQLCSTGMNTSSIVTNMQEELKEVMLTMNKDLREFAKLTKLTVELGNDCLSYARVINQYWEISKTSTESSKLKEAVRVSDLNLPASRFTGKDLAGDSNPFQEADKLPEEVETQTAQETGRNVTPMRRMSNKIPFTSRRSSDSQEAIEASSDEKRSYVSRFRPAKELDDSLCEESDAEVIRLGKEVSDVIMEMKSLIADLDEWVDEVDIEDFSAASIRAREASYRLREKDILVLHFKLRTLSRQLADRKFILKTGAPMKQLATDSIIDNIQDAFQVILENNGDFRYMREAMLAFLSADLSHDRAFEQHFKPDSPY